MSQNFLTDIQKAMIKQICESVASADGSASAQLKAEAPQLSKFFYGDDAVTLEVIKYMEDLGYISNSKGDAVLECTDAQLDPVLENKRNSCEVHCYYGNDDKIVNLAGQQEIIKVSANRINPAKNELFPCKQTFYVSDIPYVDKILDKIIDDNGISNVRVSKTSKIDWNDFYNISI